MSEQSPGTYTGKDGRTYRWRKFGPDVVLESITDVSSVVPVALAAVDIPAARAALDALVEQEEGWVEIDEHARIKRDGTAAQWRHGNGYGQNWHPLSSDDKRWPAAYRKGRSVAQQEAAEMRDAARELVRTINAMPSVTFDCSVPPIMEGGYHLAEDLRVDVNARQLMRWMDTLDKAAKKLEGKL